MNIFKNIFLGIAVLASSAVFAADDAQFAYFYTEDEQFLDAPSPFEAVTWNTGQSKSSRGIFLDQTDSSKIVLQESGVYLVTYNVTATLNDQMIKNPVALNFFFRFGLLLNGVDIIPGSVYGTAFDDPLEAEFVAEQLTGQVVFCACKGSTLQLVNDGLFDVRLIDIPGPEYTEDSVTASIVIDKLR